MERWKHVCKGCIVLVNNSDQTKEVYKARMGNGVNNLLYEG